MASEQIDFFKMVSSSLNMEIPESFVSQVGAGSLGKKWILRGINCKPCAVEVYREGTRHFLRRGWSEFYTHNSLQKDDVLVFKHRAHNLFDFKVFGQNGCEKRRREDPIIVKEEEDHLDDCDDDEEEEVDYDEEDDDSSDENYDEEEEEEDIRRPKKTKTYGGKIDLTRPSKRKYIKKNVPDSYGSEIFRSGLATRPENPFFVSRSRTLARRNELYIPKDVIEDYRLEFSEKAILVDEQGMKWDTKMKLWKDGRIWCTRGWKRLCRVNNIGPNETCICEFVRGPGSELVKEIRVRRVN